MLCFHIFRYVNMYTSLESFSNVWFRHSARSSEHRIRVPSWFVSCQRRGKKNGFSIEIVHAVCLLGRVGGRFPGTFTPISAIEASIRSDSFPLLRLFQDPPHGGRGSLCETQSRAAWSGTPRGDGCNMLRSWSNVFTRCVFSTKERSE